MSILRNLVQSVSPKQNVSLVPYYMRDFLCVKTKCKKAMRSHLEELQNPVRPKNQSISNSLLPVKFIDSTNGS